MRTWDQNTVIYNHIFSKTLPEINLNLIISKSDVNL